MAEPVDALDSGSSELLLMEVQVFLAATFFSTNALIKGIFLDFCIRVMANWPCRTQSALFTCGSRESLKPPRKGLYRF